MMGWTFIFMVTQAFHLSQRILDSANPEEID